MALVSPDRLLDRAARQSRQIAGGKQAALINLRKHQLAAPDAYRDVRGLLQVMTVVGLLFLLGFCLAVHWRASQYQQLAGRFEHMQSEVLERTFPGQKVPVGIRSRLESERTKLSALAGQSAELPKLNSELETLLVLLQALPEDVEYSWDRIRLESPGRIVLEGKVLSHGDAGVVVDALTDGGFEIEVPQTEQLPSQLVSVRIRGGRSGNAP